MSKPALLDNSKLTGFSVLINGTGPTVILNSVSNYLFRIFSIKCWLENNATIAVAGQVDIVLYDGGVTTNIATSVFVPAAAGTAIGSQHFDLIPIGSIYTSTAVGNAISIGLSVGLTAGNIRVNSLFTNANQY